MLNTYVAWPSRLTELTQVTVAIKIFMVCKPFVSRIFISQREGIMDVSDLFKPMIASWPAASGSEGDLDTNVHKLHYPGRLVPNLLCGSFDF